MAATDDEFFLPDLCNAQSILILVLITELLVFVFLLAKMSVAGFEWSEVGLTSLFVQWIVLASAALLCNLRAWLAHLSLFKSVVLAYSLVLIVTLLFTVVAQWLIYGGLAAEGMLWIVMRNLVIAAIMTGISFRYFYLQDQLRRQEQAELNSRIQALQSRIRPHFLFNSMNIIASLIAVDPELAETVVEDLSELFRASLSDMTNEPVLLSEELKLCRKYVHIEGLRLDERLSVVWDIEVDENRVRIPMLTVQPLLENAIYHGIQPLPEGGQVRVLIREHDGKLEVVITNPVAHEDHSHERGNRMAVENIRSRLEAVYGSEAEVFSKQDDKFFNMVIRYPVG